jgi:TatD DNase family protein
MIDAHCHLYDVPIALWKPSSLMGMLTVGVDRETSLKCIALTQDHPTETLWASVGHHPTDPLPFPLTDMAELAMHASVIGIGETGLDYADACTVPKATQWERLIQHIMLSNRLKKAIILHIRDAFNDALCLLTEHRVAAGMVHCFTGNTEDAKRFLDLDMYLSFSGIVTFKNAQSIQEAARYVPMDRLLIETDSPYLAPVPYRGQPNRPQHVQHVAHCIAMLKHVTVEDIMTQTACNFKRLFL